MFVIIPHPTEELKIIEFQKNIIVELFQEDRIIYRTTPLWIELPENIPQTEEENIKLLSKKIKSVKFGDVKTDSRSIFVPVEINLDNDIYSSKLTLVRIHNGIDFTESDRQLLAEKKEPVRLLKIFRLGIAQADGPYAKSISNSVWIKLPSSKR